MLVSNKATHGNELSFVDAKTGDRFYWVSLRRLTLRPIAVEAYMVLRVGDYDVSVAPVNGGGGKRIHRYSPLPNAYLTEGEVTWVKDAMHTAKKDTADANIFSR